MATEVISGPTPDAGAIAAAAAKTEIRVGGGGAIPTPVAPRSNTTVNTTPIAPPVTSEAPKPGTPMERLSKALRKKTGTEDTPEPPPKPADGVAPVEQPKTGDKPVEGTPSEAVPAKDGKNGKANPWKLLDETKKRATDLETKLHEVEKRAIPEAKFKDMESALEAQKKRNDELESHIRLMDYSKSSEFADKYQKPYEAAWNRTMGNLKGFTVEDGDGNQREFTTDDMLGLVNAPNIKEAWSAAETLVGEKFAPLLMQHRNEIRKLYDEQATALELARKNAGEHAETQAKTAKELSTQIMTQWSAVNDEAKADPKFGRFFSQKEGDAVGNQKLGKGYELVDRAFSENPNAPGLTAEQRKDIVNRHAVVRNRAAAFGRLVSWLETSEGRIADLEKELKQYRGSEPSTEGGGRTLPIEGEEKGFRGVMNRIAKKATPI